MLCLMNRALASSSSYPDKISYLTSLGIYRSLSNENSVNVAEKIKDLLTTVGTRLEGLQLLEIAIEQNTDICTKANWVVCLYDIIKEPGADIVKEHACKVLCLIIPYMAKNPSIHISDLQKYTQDIFPFFLNKVNENVEWLEAAGKCVHIGLKTFPHAFESYKGFLESLILKQVSYSVSSKTFEVFADWLCELPGCVKGIDTNSFRENWTNQYLKVLSTLQHVLNTLLSFFVEDAYESSTLDHIEPYLFEDDEQSCEQDVFPLFMKFVRRVTNLGKCVAKMLSTKTRFSVQLPIRQTLDCLMPVFQVEDIYNVKPTSNEMQIILTNLPQMQIVMLSVLEALILNSHLIQYSYCFPQLLNVAFQGTKMPSVSNESICHLRLSLWKMVYVWVCRNGAKVSNDLASPSCAVVDELMKDISIEDKDSSQTSSTQTHSKSKKNMCMNSGNKLSFNKLQQAVCKEALKTLELLIVTGTHSLGKKTVQEIFDKIVQISYVLRASSDLYPFPYDNPSCRKHLYSVLLQMVINSQPDQRELVQCAVGIFKNAFRDPSVEVIQICHKAAAQFRLYLHPKRPPPVHIDADDKRRKTNVSNTVGRYDEWNSEKYVKDRPIEPASKAAENATPRITQTFHNPNEVEIHSEDYMEIEQHYPEGAAESRCNGEDILEVQGSSSQGQDDVESEDEDEEEDEERSYGGEELNQEDIQSELYIPSTSKLQVLNPVHINPETVQNISEPEYEELRPCAKIEDNISDSSNKNLHLNGVHSIVPDEEIQSSSQPAVANENGVYGVEDEDIDEDDEGDEEEEDGSASFPADKRVSEFYDQPAKRQKLDADEVKEECQDDEREQNSRSPTLSEMKADFYCNEVDDVKS